MLVNASNIRNSDAMNARQKRVNVFVCVFTFLNACWRECVDKDNFLFRHLGGFYNKFSRHKQTKEITVADLLLTPS